LTFLNTWILHLLEPMQWLGVHFPDTIPNILPLIPLYHVSTNNFWHVCHAQGIISVIVCYQYFMDLLSAYL
jgi:hypothetical protein